MTVAVAVKAVMSPDDQSSTRDDTIDARSNDMDGIEQLDPYLP